MKVKRMSFNPTAIIASCLVVTLVQADEPKPKPVFPAVQWSTADPASVRMSARELQRARDYALSGSGSGCVTRHGHLVMAWGDQKKTYDLKSTSKSIGVTALALAIADKKMQLNAKARLYHPTLGDKPPSNKESGWLDEITVLHLATQTAGFEKPGGYGKLLFRPGTAWHYSDGGPNWLAECVTKVYKKDIQELMFERVLTPIGVTRKDLRWRNHSYRPRQLDGVSSREFGSGVHANVRAMARIGYLYLREGRWKGRQLIPREFVVRARSVEPSVAKLPEHGSRGKGSRNWSNRYGNASAHYGLLWWNNADGSLREVPRDAYWSWGLYDSLIVVIPSLDIVATRAGRSWKRPRDAAHYEVLRPFLQPIVASVRKTPVR